MITLTKADALVTDLAKVIDPPAFVREDTAYSQTAAKKLANEVLEHLKHDEVLDAISTAKDTLEEAMLQIEYLHGKFDVTGSGETVLGQIKHAMAKLAMVS